MADVAHHNLTVDTSSDWTETLTWKSGGVVIDLTGWTAVCQVRRAPAGPVVLTPTVTLGGVDGTSILTADAADLAPLAGETCVWGVTLKPPTSGESLVMEGYARFDDRIGR